jgi:hypothetical protein
MVVELWLIQFTVSVQASHLLCRLYGPKRFGTKPRWARRWAVIDAAQGFLLRGHSLFPAAADVITHGLTFHFTLQLSRAFPNLLD